MSQNQGAFSSMPPSSAALTTADLLDSQNSLLRAARYKREHAAYMSGVMEGIRIKLIDRTKKAIQQDAKKQIMQGAMSIVGGGVALGAMAASAYQTKDYQAKIDKAATEKNRLTNFKDALTDPTVKGGAIVGGGGGISPEQKRLNEIQGGNYKNVNNDPKVAKHGDFKGDYEAPDVETGKAIKHLKADGNEVAHGKVLKDVKKDIAKYETEINTYESGRQRNLMQWNMGKEGVKGMLDGTSGIYAGEMDFGKARIESRRVESEMVNQSLVGDRQLVTDSAAKYQTDASKALDLTYQIRSNNRYQ
jgi:hypothetical protein